MLQPLPEQLTPDALYSWPQIKPFVGVSRETWRRYCLAGVAPLPVMLSPRCARWRGRDVLAWLAEPKPSFLIPTGS